MLFNSYLFIFGFLPVTLIVFFSLNRFRLTASAAAWLIFASLAFYAYWSVAYLPLLIGSILFNFYIGKRIERRNSARASRTFLLTGVSANLLLLGYFKYANFFVDVVNDTTQIGWIIPKIVLPLGISFFTFTQIAYLVDAYRGETQGYNLLNYSLFVTFFPHLIAGPILYHKDIIPQFKEWQTFVYSHKNMAYGLTFFTLGLFKKVVIADNLSPWTVRIFNHPDTVTFVEAWVGALSYTFQLYFDFSGYSDMAVGLGWMLNVRLPFNFNSPYKATSIIDFWRRWHMTLSFFLKNYLYIPLGGNRKGEPRRMYNIMATMLLGGLWHGAGWTFVLWGGLHGVYLVINHLWRKLGFVLPKMAAWSITFLSVVTAWVIFRAHDIRDAIGFLKGMIGLHGVVLPTNFETRFRALTHLGVRFGGLPNLHRPVSVLAGLIVLILMTALFSNTQELIGRLKPSWWIGLTMGLTAACTLYFIGGVSEFLYFQF